MDRFVYLLICLNPLACKPVQIKDGCFLFVCPMPRIVRHTGDAQNMSLEAGNIIRTGLKP